MAYRYDGLSDSQEEIRVALLLPGSFDDEIRITFRKRRLEEEHPIYESLSYAWGSEAEPSPIYVVSGSKRLGVIHVTQNLRVALQHLRYKHRARLIWTDALCIDQQNDGEKSRQVSAMGRIYSMAKSVIAFLGPEADNSNNALEMLCEMASHLHMDWKTNTLSPSNGSSSSLAWADVNSSLPYVSGELDTVCSLLERPYFERTWIRQEVTLATDVYAQCGYRTISWNDLRVAVACLYLKDRYITASSPNRASALRRVLHSAFLLCYLARGDFLYCTLKMTLRDAKCKDPRDRLYSVLSLLQWSDQELGIKPDYSRPVEEVYVEVARRLILSQRQLSVFETCELSAKKLKGLPSWVPDWSSRLGHRVLPDATNWSACGWMSAQATITSNNVMHAAGIAIAPVEDVTEFTINEYEWDEEEIFRILRQLRPSTICPQPNNNAEWKSAVETYCRALVCDGFSENYIPSHMSYPNFEESRDLLELVWSNIEEDTLAVHSNIRGSAYVSYCQNCFIGRCFFKTNNGYIGLAPTGTRKGDLICVLLGCRFPVVLRPSSESETSRTWQVVGICHVQGLMNGEAIYSDKLPGKYRSISRREQANMLIDGWSVTLYDSETGDFKYDPAAILNDMGINVESYERYPHVLEVSPESLKAVGLAVENFALV